MSKDHYSKLLSIVIVSYNTEKLTLQTLASLVDELKASKLLKDASEIFLVDNHSSDQSLSKSRHLLSQSKIPFQIIANQENFGFAKANNQAISIAHGQYILLLNSDTLVQAGALTALVETMQESDLNLRTAPSAGFTAKIDNLGILSPTLLNSDGSIQPQGGDLPSLLSVATQMFFLDDLPFIGRFFPSTQHTGLSDFAFRTYQKNYDRLIKKDWVAGTAMLLRHSLIDEIGPLDENIFMYGEDQEICLRAKNHHFDIAIHPQATITHLGQGSSSSKNAILGEFKGYLYIFKKHKASWQLPILKAILWVGAMMRYLIYRSSSKTDKALIYQEAKALIGKK